jgi:hypothetical protein
MAQKNRRGGDAQLAWDPDGALAAPTRCPQNQKATRSSAVAVISACALQLFVGFTGISEA